MTAIPVRLGYVPLTDAAPLIIAKELGFGIEEGLNLSLMRMTTWAQARDLLGAGVVDAAQMLVPMPVAQAIGLGPPMPTLDLLMFLSLGGEAVVVSADLADRMVTTQTGIDFFDPKGVGYALRMTAGPTLRVAVPFPFSTQAELMWLLLTASGFDPENIRIVTVPPPRMADALAAGEVDAFCVGEPWASFAVDRGIGTMVLPGTAIWAAPTEKGLVVRRDFTVAHPDKTGRLMRAVWRACQWLELPENRGVAADILCRPEYLDLPSELADRGLSGRLFTTSNGGSVHCNNFISFGADGGNFPWQSIAALFAHRLAKRHNLDVAGAMRAATTCFRTDLYRTHLRPAGAPLPGASAKVEGVIRQPLLVAAERGHMTLRPDAFFDGSTFDPAIAG
ncbi:MAG: nitrate transporter [Paracoccus denitrificans]|nr:MAG: nitrate transporter [Paracoccus denitrificans]PZO83054.1 MAG: nitrate transporter [Paracoccus denitrificans]